MAVLPEKEAGRHVFSAEKHTNNPATQPLPAKRYVHREKVERFSPSLLKMTMAIAEDNTQ